MTRAERLGVQLREERKRSPGVSLRTLAKKYSVPERVVLEAFRDDGICRVKSDRVPQVLDELQSWGPVRVRVQNDFSEIEMTASLGDFALAGESLALETDSYRIKIDCSRVDSVYFVLSANVASVEFFNKKGRLMFQILALADAESRERYEKSRQFLTDMNVWKVS